MWDQVERQTLALQGQYTVLKASGNFEMSGSWPSLESARADFDEWLESNPTAPAADEYDELLDLIGVGHG